MYFEPELIQEGNKLITNSEKRRNLYVERVDRSSDGMPIGVSCRFINKTGSISDEYTYKDFSKLKDMAKSQTWKIDRS